MAVWVEVVGKEIGQEKMKRLKLIGETRWSGKSNAASVIFGNFKKPSVNTFVNLLTCLSIIQESEKFDSKTKHEANALLQNLGKLETILIAFSYLCVFEITAPLSSYLQTSGLDMFTAWNLINSATLNLKEQARSFHNIHSKALEFVSKCNELISDMNMDENNTLEIKIIETQLPLKRQRKKKKMADELANDEGNSSYPLFDFEVHVFNLIMDRIVQSLEDRFVQHKQLYKDLSCLDPINFKTISQKGLEDEALEGIMKLLPQSSKYQIKLELISFATHFGVLKLLIDNASDDIMDSSCNSCKNCSTCLSCVLKILASNRLHDNAYDNLYELYKMVCTLSVTQVHCERTFSKLKIIKNRLRNSLSEENLESYLLLSVEKELLDNLDVEKIIDRFADTSGELKRLLTYA